MLGVTSILCVSVCGVCITISTLPPPPNGVCVTVSAVGKQEGRGGVYTLCTHSFDAVLLFIVCAGSEAH